MLPWSTRVSLVLLLGFVTPMAGGSEPEEAGKGGFGQVAAIGREVAQLGDWEKQFELFEDSIDRVWEENGWNTEADVFARETVREIAAIPPWQFTRRIETLTDALGERYQLTDRQSALLKVRVYETVGQMAVQHGAEVLRQTREMVNMRLRGEPFSPDMIARWTRRNDPMVDQLRARIEEVADEVAETFSPAQKEIFERDVESYRRRVEKFDEMGRRWKEGKWRPEDWGLDDDPIHRNAAALYGPPEQASGAPIPPKGEGKPREDGPAPRYSPYEESTWARYVRLTIQRYELDDAQANSAYSILRELEARAADYRRLHRAELDKVAPEERESAEAYQPLRSLFDELRQRVERIPTAAQQRRAEDRDRAERP